MTDAGKKLTVTAILAVSAVVFLPALVEATNTLSYGTIKYGQQLELLLEQSRLLLVIFAFVVLALYTIEA